MTSCLPKVATKQQNVIQMSHFTMSFYDVMFAKSCNKTTECNTISITFCGFGAIFGKHDVIKWHHKMAHLLQAATVS